MKKLILSAALLLSVTAAGFAQEKRDQKPKSAEEIARLHTDKLAEKLSLSAEQKEQVYALNLERSQKLAARHKENMAAMKSLREERQAEETQLMKLLTPEQQQAYTSLKEERRSKFAGKRGKHGPHKGDRRH
jgi:protein CpxP